MEVRVVTLKKEGKDNIEEWRRKKIFNCEELEILDIAKRILEGC
jgi:hypothetical protein